MDRLLYLFEAALFAVFGLLTASLATQIAPDPVVRWILQAMAGLCAVLTVLCVITSLRKRSRPYLAPRGRFDLRSQSQLWDDGDFAGKHFPP